MSIKKNISEQEIINLSKRWFAVLIWSIILLILIQSVGIVIHEFGHYFTGKLFLCDNLKISIAKLSWKDSISNVSGWESCKTPLVIARNGSRICNLKTNLISLAGLNLSLLIFVPLLIFINSFFKKKYPKLYLQGHFLAIILIFVISMIVQSAIYDLFKIVECLFNTQIGEIAFRLINAISDIMNLLIIMFFAIDLIRIIGFLIDIKKRGLKK